MKFHKTETQPNLWKGAKRHYTELASETQHKRSLIHLRKTKQGEPKTQREISQLRNWEQQQQQPAENRFVLSLWFPQQSNSYACSMALTDPTSPALINKIDKTQASLSAHLIYEFVIKCHLKLNLTKIWVREKKKHKKIKGITRSPMLQAFVSSWAINFEVRLT